MNDERAPNEHGAVRPHDAVDGDQTLVQEAVWSVGLIGGVIAFLVLVAHFAA
jgi:hypothetical protein